MGNVEGYVRRGTWPVPKCFVNAVDCLGEDFCAFGDKCSDGVCEVCSEGYFCDDGDLETACPVGFNSKKGAKSVEECFEVEVTTGGVTTEAGLTTSGSSLNSAIAVLLYNIILII